MKKPKFLTAAQASGTRVEPPAVTLPAMVVLHRHYRDITILHERMIAPASADSLEVKMMLLSAETRLVAAMLCIAAGYPTKDTPVT